MKVFHFSLKPPYPKIDGGCVAIANLLELLCEEHTVYHFTLATYKHPFELSKYPEKIKEEIQIEQALINTKIKPFQVISHLIKNQSYHVSRFYNKQVDEQLNKILKHNKFDLVIVESIFLLPYLKSIKKYGVKIFVRSHNVEYKIWKSLAQSSKNPLKKWYLNTLSRQLKKFEIEQLNLVDGILYISKNDQTTLESDGVKTLSTTFSLAIKIDAEENNYKINDLYFLGAMDWLPNLEALDWFIKEVLSKKSSIEFKLNIAGRKLNCNTFNHENIICHGEVEDATQFIKKHGICVIPIISGSGIKIKLLESMAQGKPIICTRFSAAGIDAKNGEHLLFADTPEEFRKAVTRLTSDENLRKRIGLNAKKYIFEHFQKEKINKQIIELFERT